QTTAADIGAIPLPLVTFIIYNDTNGNGHRDSGEPLLPNLSTTYTTYTTNSEVVLNGDIHTNAAGRADVRVDDLFGGKSMFVRAPSGMRVADEGDFVASFEPKPDAHLTYYVGFT